MVPDGDLFASIRRQKASIVTDHIQRFTPDGILLRSGEELKADIIVLATGLKIKLLGGIHITVDGKTIHTNESMVYKGMMVSDVPNLAIAFEQQVFRTLKAAEQVAARFAQIDDRHDEIVPASGSAQSQSQLAKVMAARSLG